MRSLIAIAALAACSVAWAQIQLNQISNDTVADADKVMENFNALKDGINSNEVGKVSIQDIRDAITVVSELCRYEVTVNNGGDLCELSCPDGKVALSVNCYETTHPLRFAEYWGVGGDRMQCLSPPATSHTSTAWLNMSLVCL